MMKTAKGLLIHGILGKGAARFALGRNRGTVDLPAGQGIILPIIFSCVAALRLTGAAYSKGMRNTSLFW